MRLTKLNNPRLQGEGFYRVRLEADQKIPRLAAHGAALAAPFAKGADGRPAAGGGISKPFPHRGTLMFASLAFRHNLLRLKAKGSPPSPKGTLSGRDESRPYRILHLGVGPVEPR